MLQSQNILRTRLLVCLEITRKFENTDNFENSTKIQIPLKRAEISSISPARLSPCMTSFSNCSIFLFKSFFSFSSPAITDFCSFICDFSSSRWFVNFFTMSSSPVFISDCTSGSPNTIKQENTLIKRSKEMFLIRAELQDNEKNLKHSELFIGLSSHR